jgi:hypothetical protein
LGENKKEMNCQQPKSKKNASTHWENEKEAFLRLSRGTPTLGIENPKMS